MTPGGETVPLYEYECQKCHRRTEKIEGVNGPHLKKCPHCGGKLERMISSPAIQFKGTGWYVTDYAGKKGAPPGESGSSAKSETKDSGSKEGSGEKPSSKESSASDLKEKKTAKKKD
jgi:putative FmdB family regulatory protein